MSSYYSTLNLMLYSYLSKNDGDICNQKQMAVMLVILAKSLPIFLLMLRQIHAPSSVRLRPPRKIFWLCPSAYVTVLSLRIMLPRACDNPSCYIRPFCAITLLFALEFTSTTSVKRNRLSRLCSSRALACIVTVATLIKSASFLRIRVSFLWGAECDVLVGWINSS